MAKDNVDYLPIWKANATAEERFMELAMMARKHPERFNKMVVIYQEDVNKDGWIARYQGSANLTTNEILGLLEIAKFEVLKHVYEVTCDG
jgi:hypothetical protein